MFFIHWVLVEAFSSCVFPLHSGIQCGCTISPMAPSHYTNPLCFKQHAVKPYDMPVVTDIRGSLINKGEKQCPRRNDHGSKGGKGLKR